MKDTFILILLLGVLLFAGISLSSSKDDNRYHPKDTRLLKL